MQHSENVSNRIGDKTQKNRTTLDYVAGWFARWFLGGKRAGWLAGLDKASWFRLCSISGIVSIITHAGTERLRL